MSVQEEYEAAIRRAVSLIVANLDQPTTFRDIAREVCISPFHFHRIFRAKIGESPAELSRRLRMESAAKKLIETAESIGRIAVDAAFGSPEAFSKAFQSLYKITPSEMRRSHSCRVALPTPIGLHVQGHEITPYALLDEGYLDMETSIVELPDMRLAGLPHSGAYWLIGQTFGRVGAIAGPLGLFGRPGANMVGIYYDDPNQVPEAELRSVAGVVTTEDAGIGDLQEYRTQGGRYVKGTFVGSYDQLGAAWQTFFGKYVLEMDVKVIDGPCLEIYLVHDEANPQNCVTELVAPIE